MAPRLPVAARRRLPLLALAALSLAGCGSVVPPGKFIQEPENIPANTAAPLDTTPTVTGTIKNWTGEPPQPISLEWPPERVVGQVKEDGSFTATLPADPGTRGQQSLEQRFVDGYFWEVRRHGGPCPVSTIRAEPAGAQVVVASLLVPLKAASTGSVRPATSPPPPTNRFLSARIGNDFLWFVHIDRDVTLRGERKCIHGYGPGGSIFDQVNLVANITLRKGWNALRERFDYTSETGVPGVRLMRNSLEAVLPATGVEWTVY